MPAHHLTSTLPHPHPSPYQHVKHASSTTPSHPLPSHLLPLSHVLHPRTLPRLNENAIGSGYVNSHSTPPLPLPLPLPHQNACYTSNETWMSTWNASLGSRGRTPDPCPYRDRSPCRHWR